MSYTDAMERRMGESERFAEVTVPLCDRTVWHEITREITLPDYEPEIRRVLSVSETVLPPAKYVGGGRVELNGGVEYRLLCVTAEGGLHTVIATGEYEGEVPLETRGGEVDLGEGVCVTVQAVTDQIGARLSAPRRLSLRHKLRSRVRAFGKMTMGESRTGEEAEGICRRKVSVEGMTVSVAASEPICVKDDVSLPSASSRVVSAEGTVFVSSVLPKDGGITVSGEVILRLIAETDGAAQSLCRRIPFEGQIENSGFSEGGSACAEGVVESLTVSAEEGRALCECEILLRGRALCTETVSYTEDLYSTERMCECEYREQTVPVAIKCENRNFSQSERIPLSEARISEGATVVDAWGTVSVEGCEQRGDSFVQTGKSRYRLLLQNEGEYSVTEIELPFRYESEAGGRTLSASECAAEVISCRARVDDTSLALDAEIAVCADYMGEGSVRWVSDVRVGARREEKRPCMLVYYPTPTDSAWSVAKKYGVPEQDLHGDLGSYFFF